MICTAKRSNGQPCRAAAIRGGNICQAHGGSAPQVIAAAKRRLLTLVDPALGVLARAVRPRRNKYWEPTSTEIQAVREIMRLAGFSAAEDAAGDGTVLWEEFIAIHRRVTTTGAVTAKHKAGAIEGHAVAVD